MNRAPALSAPRWLWLLLPALLVPAVAQWSADPAWIGHDEAMYFSGAGLLLDGAVPYRDFFELNPPLILYLSVPPVALARLLGLAPELVFQPLLLLLGSASVVAFARLLRRLVPDPGGLQRWLLAAAFGLALLGSSRTGMLGQREGLFTLALGPWLALRAARADGAVLGRGGAVLTGAVAGLGLCLKPHFLLVALAAELVWLRRAGGVARLLVPETVAAGAVGAGYALHFALLPAAARAGFFHWVVPLVRAGYPAFHQELGTLLAVNAAELEAGALVLLLAFLLSRKAPLERLYAPFAAVAVAGHAIVLMQSMGWNYHWRIAALGQALAGGVAVTAIVARLEARPRLPRVVLPVAAALATLAVLAVASPSARYDKVMSFRAVERWTAPGDGVLVLSSRVADSFPGLLLGGRRPASRYLWMFPLPLIERAHLATYRGQSSARSEPLTADERRFAGELASDIGRSRPPLVLIEAGSCQGCRARTSFRSWAMHLGVLRQALAGYVWVGTENGFDVLVPERQARGAVFPPPAIGRP